MQPTAPADEPRAPDSAVTGHEAGKPGAHEEGVTAFLYDADGADGDIAPGEVDFEALAEDDLLWIDADSSHDGAFERVADLLPLSLDTLRGMPKDPFVRDVGDAFVLAVRPLASDQDAAAQSAMLICFVGRNWFVTIHEGHVGSLRAFADHLRGDSTLGRLDAPSFLAQVLEWVLNAYFLRLDELQQTIDDLEVRILQERPHDDIMEELVKLRRDTGQLRRRLSPHRQVFITLAHPSFDVISGSSAAAEFSVLVDRLETALQAIDTTREMVVGSFDVFMTRTAQRTNDIVRVLTLVSVVLLPATVIAGVFGMNMLPKYLLQTWVFWAALGLMVVVASTLLLAVHAFFSRR